MCGIFGVLNQQNATLDLQYVKELSELAKHRGPESSNMLFETNYVFGFHRLAINGLNTISNQPFQLENCTLICNGEIYNYRTLFNSMKIVPHTNSDCEVIIHLYKRFGAEYMLQQLDGVFSFMLYDGDTGTMIVARDPYGVRPLFKTRFDGANTFGFSSELKQLYPLKKMTHCSVIEQFPPGSYEVYTVDSASNQFEFTAASKYTTFSFNTISCLPQDNWNVYFDMIRNKLEEAVKKRVTSTDRPIACLLSGGLDSSLITSIVKKYYEGELETYSIGLKGGEDLKYAQQVADYLGTKHTEIVVDENDFFDAIPEVIKQIESFDTTTVRASVGNYIIGKYIACYSKAKVIFNGDGSDELCGGYLYFHKAPNAFEFDLECKRLLNNIHFFDVLRSDRCISTNGLEPRTPFLDRGWVETYLSVPAQIRNHAQFNLPEKYLLRKAFDTGEYLPDNILWRTKEAFSDGVSSLQRSWYEIISEKVNARTSFLLDDVSNKLSLEQRYYRQLFDSYYNGCDNVVPYYWMPRFVEASDASARTLQVYNQSAV